MNQTKYRTYILNSRTYIGKTLLDLGLNQYLSCVNNILVFYSGNY